MGVAGLPRWSGDIEPPRQSSEDPAPVGGLRELERWARQRHPETRFRLRGVSPSAVAPLIEQYDRLARLYPEVAARIADILTDDLPMAARPGEPTVWARAATPPDAPTPRITLNNRTYDRLSRVRDRRREAVERGWHPSGTNDPAAITTHEFGHHLMFWLQDRGIDVGGEVASLGSPRALSRYARTNAEEAFAEAFTAHLHGDEASRTHPISRGVLGIIDREIARARAEESSQWESSQ